MQAVTVEPIPPIPAPAQQPGSQAPRTVTVSVPQGASPRAQRGARRHHSGPLSSASENLSRRPKIPYLTPEENGGPGGPPQGLNARNIHLEQPSHARDD